MSRTNKFLSNSISTALLQIVTMIIGFITPRVMLASYGSEINGLVSSISQFISYFNLVEAGLAGAAVYSLYKPLVENDHQGINAIISAAKKFYTKSGYAFVSLVMGMAIIYPMYVNTESLSPLSVGVLIGILGSNGFLEFFTLSKYRVLLSADQKTYIISIASIIQIIFNTIIIVVLASLHTNIVILRAVVVLPIFLRSLILMVYVKAKYKFIDYNAVPNNKALDKRWDAFYLQILGTVHTGAPIVLATIFTNLKMVSIYSIFNMVLYGLNGLLSIFISGLSASFGEVIAKKEQKTLQRAYSEFEFIYVSVITIVYSITIVMLMPFIRLYTRNIQDANYDLPILGMLFVINGILYNCKTPQGMLVISAGLYKETRVQTTIQALISVLGGIILAPFLGLYGILTASVLSNLYRNIDLLFFIPHNLTKLPVRNTFYRWMRMLITVILVLLPFQMFKYQPQSYLAWFLIAMVVGLWVLAVCVVIACLFEKEEIKNIVYRIKALLKLK